MSVPTMQFDACVQATSNMAPSPNSRVGRFWVRGLIHLCAVGVEQQTSSFVNCTSQSLIPFCPGPSRFDIRKAVACPGDRDSQRGVSWNLPPFLGSFGRKPTRNQPNPAHQPHTTAKSPFLSAPVMLTGFPEPNHQPWSVGDGNQTRSYVQKLEV